MSSRIARLTSGAAGWRLMENPPADGVSDGLLDGLLVDAGGSVAALEVR